MAEGRVWKKKAGGDMQLAQMTVHAQLLFAYASSHVDVAGRINASPLAVRKEIVPANALLHSEQWSVRLVEAYMAEWTETTPYPLALIYDVLDELVAYLPGAPKNNRLRLGRERPSVLPPPPAALLAAYAELRDAVSEVALGDAVLLRDAVPANRDAAPVDARRDHASGPHRDPVPVEPGSEQAPEEEAEPPPGPGHGPAVEVLGAGLALPPLTVPLLSGSGLRPPPDQTRSSKDPARETYELVSGLVGKSLRSGQPRVASGELADVALKFVDPRHVDHGTRAVLALKLEQLAERVGVDLPRYVTYAATELERRRADPLQPPVRNESRWIVEIFNRQIRTGRLA